MQDNHEKVLVLDFGGQYNQLIARRVREHNVYAEIKPYSRITVDEIKAAGYVGIIFTGGPNSVYDESSPHYSPEILDAGIPVLGICYGAQLIAYMAGGVVKTSGSKSEYGKIDMTRSKDSRLLKNIPEDTSVCWMSHTDYISNPPKGYKVTAVTRDCPARRWRTTRREFTPFSSIPRSCIRSTARRYSKHSSLISVAVRATGSCQASSKSR